MKKLKVMIALKSVDYVDNLMDLACRVAKGMEAELVALHIRARQVPQTIVSEAEEQQIDLLLLGYHHKNPVAEILLGSTAQYVARHAPCRAIVEIPPLAAPRHIDSAASDATR